MKKIILTSIFCFSSLNVLAKDGQDGNGGDPRVAEFLASTQVVCNWMQKNVVLTAYADKCFAELKDLTNSVNLNMGAARITSTTQDVKDSHGVLKDAVTDLATRTILINVDRWEKENALGHQITSVMEISLLIGVPNRYEVAQMFMKDQEKAANQHMTTSGTDCSTTQDAMSSLIDTYISVLKACYAMEQSGQKNSNAYQQEVTMAKTIEAAYAKDVIVCNQVCSSTLGCNGITLTGACKGDH